MDAWTLFLAVENPEAGLLSRASELSSFGLVSFLVVWFVVKIHPAHIAAIQKMTEQFNAGIAAERAAHDAARIEDRKMFIEERQKDREQIAGTIERNTLATRELTAAFRGACGSYTKVGHHEHANEKDH